TTLPPAPRGHPAFTTVGPEAREHRTEQVWLVHDRQGGGVREVVPHVHDHRCRTRGAGGVHTVREQHHEHVALGIYPDGRTCEARVPERTRAQELARPALAVGGVPAECARVCGACGEELHGGIRNDAHAVVLAAVEHHLREHGEV